MRESDEVKGCGIDAVSTVNMMERQSKGRRHGTSVRKKRTSKNNGLADSAGTSAGGRC